MAPVTECTRIECQHNFSCQCSRKEGVRIDEKGCKEFEEFVKDDPVVIFETSTTDKEMV